MGLRPISQVGLNKMGVRGSRYQESNVKVPAQVFAAKRRSREWCPGDHSGWLSNLASRIVQQRGERRVALAAKVDVLTPDRDHSGVGLDPECLATLKGQPMDLLVVFLADFVADQVEEIAQPQCRARLIESQATAVVVIECGRARLKSRIAGLVHDGSLDAFNQYGYGRTVYLRWRQVPSLVSVSAAVPAY